MYIRQIPFPNGKLPSAEQITAAANGHLVLEDRHSCGQDCDRTLMAWWEKFNAASPRLEAKYERRVYRMWKYYLLSCAGFFRSRQGQLWQLSIWYSANRNIHGCIGPCVETRKAV